MKETDARPKGPSPRHLYRLELACKHFGREGRVLDVGCGAGAWSRWIADALPGLEPHGVDVVDGCTADIAFQRYDGRHLPYPDGHMAAVVAFSVLHHAEDPEQVVSEMSRVCRPGGKVMVVEDIASSRLQTLITGAHDLYANRIRNLVRALRGTHRWAMARVPMTYEYRSYPEWIAMFDAHGLGLIEMKSVPQLTIEHGVMVLEKR